MNKNKNSLLWNRGNHKLSFKWWESIGMRLNSISMDCSSTLHNKVVFLHYGCLIIYGPYSIDQTQTDTTAGEKYSSL